MRTLVTDEVSKEISEKGIRLAFRFVGQPTLKAFMKGLKFVVGKPAKFVAGKVGHTVSQKIHPTEGKQSVKTLIRQGQGVSSIPLADDGLKDFQQIAKKYGVDFAFVKDKSVNPPIYTVFFKAKDMDAITRIMTDYQAKQIKDKERAPRQSVLKRLEKMKEKVASIPKKILEKKKVMER